MSSRNTCFKPDWLTKKDPNGELIITWCEKVDESTASCKLCGKQLKVNQSGLTALNQHASTAKHKDNVKAAESSCKINKFFVPSSSNTGTPAVTCSQTCRAEGIWTLFTIKHNLSFHSQDKAGQCFASMFPSDPTAKEFSCGRTKMSYLNSHGFYPYFFDQLCIELKNTFFTFHIDEASDSVKRLGINVRFLLPNTWSLHCQLFLLNEIESSDANTMTQEVLSALSDNDIPMTNLIAAMTDNCATMIGNKGGVVTQLRTEMPHMIELEGCSLHLVHNAAKVAVGTFDDLEQFVCDVHSYFRKRPSLFNLFKDFQNSEDVENHQFIRFVETRWLQMKPVVDRIIEQYPALTKFYEEEFKSSDRHQRIMENLESKLTIAKLCFVSYSLTTMEKFEKLFQNEGQQIHILHDAMCDLLKIHLRKFVKSRHIDEDAPWKTGIGPSQQLKNSKLLIGEATKKCVSELSVTEKDLFYSLVRQFYEVLTRKLTQKIRISGAWDFSSHQEGKVPR